MREIEFRAFRMNYGDAETSVMTESFTMANLQDKDGFNFTNDTYAEWDEFGLYHPDTIIMQYTGLKDKNGKKIFEGDIFKKRDDTYLVECKETHDGFHWRRIHDSWLNRNVFNENKRSWLSKVDSNHSYEIIGDIHQDKHLLK